MGNTEQVEVSGLAEIDATAEQRGRMCPEGAFVSGIGISRGHEPQGAYDLYEFNLVCSEVLEPPPPPPPQDGYTTRGFSSSARGDTAAAARAAAVRAAAAAAAVTAATRCRGNGRVPGVASSARCRRLSARMRHLRRRRRAAM